MRQFPKRFPTERPPYRMKLTTEPAPAAAMARYPSPKGASGWIPLALRTASCSRLYTTKRDAFSHIAPKTGAGRPWRILSVLQIKNFRPQHSSRGISPGRLHVSRFLLGNRLGPCSGERRPGPGTAIALLPDQRGVPAPWTPSPPPPLLSQELPLHDGSKKRRTEPKARSFTTLRVSS